MYTATATVPTDRAARYRDQLASHSTGLMRHGGASNNDGHTAPPVLSADIEDDTLVLSLAWGSCRITATQTALELLAEANTLEDLARIQSGIANRIQKIGRRDNLAVAWSETDGSSHQAATIGERPRHSLQIILGIAVLVLVMIAVHVGLAAELIKHHWAWWALALIPVIVVLKLTAGRHLMFRHGRRSH